MVNSLVYFYKKINILNKKNNLLNNFLNIAYFKERIVYLSMLIYIYF